MEQNIARCRLVLSIAAMLAVYIDPAVPLLARWLPLSSGPFVMDTRLLAIMVLHLVYSVSVYVALWRNWVHPERIVGVIIWVDVVFGAAIGALTEGATSPSYVFFAFAVVAAALRAGLRQTLGVTTATVGLYWILILVSSRGNADEYIMRPVYLAITGYLVGYLGQQRLELQDEMQRLEGIEQRHRIGRDLHDNFAQALAGINLRLEGCRKRLRADPTAEMLPELTELQDAVRREFDELRNYTRSLAGLDRTITADDPRTAMRLSVHADVSGPFELVDHVLQIAHEGINNVRRHAHANAARIDIRDHQCGVRINIEDDGVGFDSDALPWSIASRVREIGGSLELINDRPQGSHLLITVPQS